MATEAKLVIDFGNSATRFNVVFDDGSGHHFKKYHSVTNTLHVCRRVTLFLSVTARRRMPILSMLVMCMLTVTSLRTSFPRV